jgi:FkbM family methyltransferase
MSVATNALKNILGKLGIVAHRANLYSDEHMRLLRFLEANAINTVLDIGANRGQYALGLISRGYKGKIYSFEPLPDMHAILTEQARAYPDQWIVAPPYAVSDSRGVAKFNITRTASSSSMLKPGGAVEAFPEIFAVDKVIEVQTETLTDIFESLGINSDSVFLKLDVQGAESAALKGSVDVLPRIKGIVTEMPVRKIYEGQASLRELDEWIVGHGFSLWDILPVYRESQTGRLNQVDMTYFKSDLD